MFLWLPVHAVGHNMSDYSTDSSYRSLQLPPALMHFPGEMQLISNQPLDMG